MGQVSFVSDLYIVIRETYIYTYTVGSTHLFILYTDMLWGLMLNQFSLFH